MTGQRQLLFWFTALIVAVYLVLTLQTVLLPFVAGLIIAYAINPLADALERLGLPRVVAAIVVVTILVLMFVLALFILVPMIVRQTEQLITSGPAEIAKLGHSLDVWGREKLGQSYINLRNMIGDEISTAIGKGASLAGVLFKSLWNQGRAFINFVSVLLITPLVIFYLLVDWRPIFTRLDSWLPRDHRATIRKLIAQMDLAISAFIRGQGLVCIVLAAYYATTLSAIGLKYGLLLGLATGVITFVPFVGWMVGFVIAALFGLVQGWPEMALFLKVVAIFLAGQVLDTAFLTPRIVGTRVGLHPVGLIFALMLFSSLFGVVGALVAVPVAAAAMVLVRFGIALYLKSGFYRGMSDAPHVPSQRPPTE